MPVLFLEKIKKNYGSASNLLQIQSMLEEKSIFDQLKEEFEANFVHEIKVELAKEAETHVEF